MAVEADASTTGVAIVGPLQHPAQVHPQAQAQVRAPAPAQLERAARASQAEAVQGVQTNAR